MWRVAMAALVATACGSDGPDDSNASATPVRPGTSLAVLDIAVEPAAAPRDGATLVAGERVRVGFRVRGGRPPYRVALVEPPLRGELSVAPEAGTAYGVETAVQLELDARTPSGDYDVPIRVTDGAGATATAAATVTVIGDGRTDPPLPATAPWVAVVDVSGRHRAAYLRGERIAIRGDLGGVPGGATVAITEPDGTPLASSPALLEPGKPFEMWMAVPRLARPGAYGIVVTQDETVARGTLTVLGAPYPPATELAIDALSIRGGTDRRTDRKARLLRGEPVLVEARFGGWTAEVAGRLRVRDGDGNEVAAAELGTARPTPPRPDARAFLAAEWTAPASLAPGRYTIEVELREGDDVSSVYREVRVD